MKIKPLRKPENLILSNEDYEKKRDLKKLSSEFLLTKNLGTRFRGLEKSSSISESFTNNKSFSFRNYSDYVCSILNTKLVSDENGRVADILLTVPPNRSYNPQIPSSAVDSSDKRHLSTLIKLMYNVDEDRHFTMLCHSYQITEVESWFTGLGISNSKYSLNISVFDYSIWAQDAYVALEDQNTDTIICEGVLFPRVDDHSIADDISAQTNNSTLQSYLFFQGGNILQVGDYVLIGKDYIDENLGRAHLETEAKILDAFKSLFGKGIISLGRSNIIPGNHRQVLGGGYYQPIFHIDMYVTPTGMKAGNGKDIVVVASPKLGRQAVGEQSKTTDYDIYFDETAQQLSQYFEVVRIPILPSKISWMNRQGKVQTRYYYLSFNNSIVENYDGNSNIYLPTFSQDVQGYLNDNSITHYEGTLAKRQDLDNEAKRVWESLGFTVYQMDGLEDLAIGWGSVHCITKTLKRKSGGINV